MPEKKDFIIKDRRIFAEEDKAQKEKVDKAEPSKEEVKAREPEEDDASEEAEADFQLPEINFPTFIFNSVGNKLP